MTTQPPPAVSAATVARLPVYLRSLEDLAADDQNTVSSQQLATLVGVNANNVRKDLSALGFSGTRGVGYQVTTLLRQIGLVLGDGQPSPVIIVGAGNLGRALSHYDGFNNGGFPIAALVDVDPKVVGEKISGLKVEPLSKLTQVVAKHQCTVGIIAPPAAAAQAAADHLVKAGVRSLLNFAPGVVTVPNTVTLRKVDLATELHILGYHEQQQQKK